MTSLPINLWPIVTHSFSINNQGFYEFSIVLNSSSPNSAAWRPLWIYSSSHSSWVFCQTQTWASGLNTGVATTLPCLLRRRAAALSALAMMWFMLEMGLKSGGITRRRGRQLHPFKTSPLLKPPELASCSKHSTTSHVLLLLVHILKLPYVGKVVWLCRRLVNCTHLVIPFLWYLWVSGQFTARCSCAIWFWFKDLFGG